MSHPTKSHPTRSQTISEQLIQWRWLLVAMVLALVFFLASGARFIAFAGDYEAWFSPDNPQLKTFLSMQRTYEKSDSVVFVLTPKEGDVFNRKTLSSVEWLTEQGWQMPFSTRVNSVTNYQHTYATEDELVVEDLVEGAEEFSKTDLVRVKDVALNEPTLRNLIISPDGKVTAVAVTIHIPKNEPNGTPQIAAYARDLVEQLKGRDSNIKVHLSGITMLDNAFMEASQNDMGTLTPLMFAVILIGLLLLLRSVFATLTTLIIIVLAIVATMGFSGWIGISLTPPSAVAPIIIMTIAVANTVHIVLAFLYAYGRGESKKDAITGALTANLKPVGLASITTIIGFLSMHFSDIPPFHDLGNMVAMGVVVTFLLSITLLPALILLFPIKARAQEADKNTVASFFSSMVIKHRVIILPLLLVIVGVMSAGIAKNEMNEVITEYFEKSIQFRTDADYAAEHLTGAFFLDFSVDSGVSGGVSNPAFLRNLEGFTAWLNTQDEVVHVLSLSDTMKRLNKNLHADLATEYKLPTSQELAAQYLLLYDLSLPYGMDLSNQINIKKSSTRVLASLHNISTQKMLGLTDRVDEWFAQNSPAYSVSYSSPPFMFSHIAQRAVGRMAISVVVAMSMIAVLIALALGSIKMGLISMVPNVFPAAMAFGLWGYFNGEVSFAMAVGITVAIGIIVDDTVHFLSKYMHARNVKGLSPEGAVTYAFEHVGKALVVTSIVLTAGFLILASSPFKLNAELGLITTLSINAALILDFLLLPVLLLVFDKDKQPAVDNASASTSRTDLQTSAE
ncbi:MAG: MMPL family transporter [Pseudomonadales bacterium]|nr:MMPL family transporter [Pseudomonadales bacterium]